MGRANAMMTTTALNATYFALLGVPVMGMDNVMRMDNVFVIMAGMDLIAIRVSSSALKYFVGYIEMSILQKLTLCVDVEIAFHESVSIWR